MSLSQKNSYRMPVSLREWIVCTFASMTLVFTAWSLGGYKTWALHLLFCGGLGTFLASVVPMPSSWNGYDSQHGNLQNFKRLLRQPFFWFSLCFLGYILIQYLNPSLVQVFGEKSWWVESMTPPLGSHLPTSVKADYETMNALRTFVIQASAVCLASGILVGIQRRKTALIILWLFVTSGVAMGFVAILQKFSDTDLILWLFESANITPWGTFVYRNQGAAFLLLVLLISAVLYTFYLKGSMAKLKKGGPHFLCFMFIFLLYGSVWLSLSRGGMILGAILVLIFCVVALGFNLLSIFRGGSVVMSLITMGLLVSGGLFMLQFSNWVELDKRVENLEQIIKNIDTYDRTLTTRATWEMAQDRLIWGWGAGSFRYVFPIYQKNYNPIWYYKYNEKRGWYWRKIYHYAHNDWVQFLAEYGLIGCLFLLGIFMCLIFLTVSLFFISKSASFLLACGLMLIVIHNFVDYIFSSPSYWVAFLGSLFLVLKLYKLEKRANNYLRKANA